MKKIVRLTESDLTRIVRRIINEQEGDDPCRELINALTNRNVAIPQTCKNTGNATACRKDVDTQTKTNTKLDAKAKEYLSWLADCRKRNETKSFS